MANRSFCQRAFHFGSKKDIHRLVLQKIQFSVGGGIIPARERFLALTSLFRVRVYYTFCATTNMMS